MGVKVLLDCNHSRTPQSERDAVQKALEELGYVVVRLSQYLSMENDEKLLIKYQVYVIANNKFSANIFDLTSGQQDRLKSDRKTFIAYRKQSDGKFDFYGTDTNGSDLITACSSLPRLHKIKSSMENTAESTIQPYAKTMCTANAEPISFQNQLILFL